MATTTVDRVALWVWRQTVSSPGPQMDQVKRRVGRFALECFQLQRRRRVQRATFWSLKACTFGFRGDGTLSVGDFATETHTTTWSSMATNTWDEWALKRRL